MRTELSPLRADTSLSFTLPEAGLAHHSSPTSYVSFGQDGALPLELLPASWIGEMLCLRWWHRLPSLRAEDGATPPNATSYSLVLKHSPMLNLPFYSSAWEWRLHLGEGASLWGLELVPASSAPSSLKASETFLSVSLQLGMERPQQGNQGPEASIKHMKVMSGSH